MAAVGLIKALPACCRHLPIGGELPWRDRRRYNDPFYNSSSKLLHPLVGQVYFH